MENIDEILLALTSYLKENKPKYLYNQTFTPNKIKFMDYKNYIQI